MNNIILIGYRGVGKSSCATYLSKTLGLPIVRTDEEIEKNVGTLKEFIEKKGWDVFRQEENAVLQQVTSSTPAKQSSRIILDCGGGIIEDPANRTLLKRFGTVIWLNASVDTIKKRISPSQRPSLSGKPVVDEVEEIVTKRTPGYEHTAHYTVSSTDRTIEEIGKEIVQKVERNRVCVPIAASSISTMKELIASVEQETDIIELRLDFLSSFEDVEQLYSSTHKDIIVTCRPPTQGGKYKGEEHTRLKLFSDAIAHEVAYIDIEFESDEQSKQHLLKERGKTQIILSTHDFEGTGSPSSLEETYKDMKSYGPDLIKYVTFAQSVLDCFTILDFLQGKEHVVGFCMGQKGKASRILGAVYGSVITYVVTGGIEPTAPGQLTLSESHRFQYRKLNETYQIYGVVAQDALKSLSCVIHNNWFAHDGISAVYVPFSVEPEELEAFVEATKRLGIKGLSVTIPHKEHIMSMLDAVDDQATTIGAVNTVSFEGGSMRGTNTDYLGALDALKEHTAVSGKHVLVLGAGGAARAIVYGLVQEGSHVTITNRSLPKAQQLAAEFSCDALALPEMEEGTSHYDIIINTTSVGMGDGKSLIKESLLKSSQVVMDIVYVPLHTPLITAAKNKGCTIITGQHMLLHQAKYQYALWTGRTPSVDIVEHKLIEELKESGNLS